MGQAQAAPVADNSVKEYVNFPKEAIESLWTSYNLNGEGWGLNIDDFVAIFQGAPFIAANYKFDENSLKNLFHAFDTDDNGLIDAIEMFIGIALVSGMDTVDKIYFAFNAYDFDSVGSLSLDEVTLLLRSSAKGLSKACPTNKTFSSPTPLDFDKYAALILNGSLRVTADHFRNYCSSHIVISSWLRSVGMFPSFDTPAPNVLAAKRSPVAASVFPAGFAPSRRARLPVAAASNVSAQQLASLRAEESATAQAIADAIAAAEEKKAALLAALEAEEDGGGGGDEDGEAKPQPKVDPVWEAAQKALLPKWMSKTDMTKPEDMSGVVVRLDQPEDAIEPSWTHGMNTAGMSRCAHYSLGVFEPPSTEKPEEGAEPPVPVVDATNVWYTAANRLVCLSKPAPAPDADAPPAWVQTQFVAHSAPITCIEVNSACNCIVTADVSNITVWDHALSHAPGGDNSLPPIVNRATAAVRLSFSTPLPIKAIDLSANGKLLLVGYSDDARTVNVFDISSGSPIVVFAKQISATEAAASDGGRKPAKIVVEDVRFSGSSSLFAVALSGAGGVKFFVEDGASFMGDSAMKAFECREGLLQAAGQPAKGFAVTTLCRGSKPDEMLVGTAGGHVSLWRGRLCTSLVNAHTKAAVTSIAFDSATGNFVSTADNGTVCVINVDNSSGGVDNQSPSSRVLTQVATFDIRQHDLSSYDIRSVSLAPIVTIPPPVEPAEDAPPMPPPLPFIGHKALVCTAAGEMLEVASAVIPPTAAELAQEAAKAEAAAAKAAAAAAGGDDEEKGEDAPAADEADEEGGVAAAKQKLGDDVNGSPILCCHAGAGSGIVGVVTGLCKIGTTGFASCGADGFVRTWSIGQADGSAAHKMTKSVAVDCGGSAIDAKADGSQLAIALRAVPGSTAANEARNGAVQIFNLPDLKYVTELKQNASVINDVKFSAEGNLLAAASADGGVHVYSYAIPEGAENGEWTLKGTTAQVGIAEGSVGAGTAEALKVDFSSDGNLIRVSYSTGDLRIFEVNGGSAFGADLTNPAPPPAPAAPVDGEDAPEPPPPSAGAEAMRAATWNSNSVPYSWENKGTLSFYLPDSQKANGFERSQHLFLSALANGEVAVERVPMPDLPAHLTLPPVPAAPQDDTLAPPPAPVLVPSAAAPTLSDFVRVAAHTGPVSAILIVPDEAGVKLITAGSTDGCIRVWNVTYDAEEPEPDVIEEDGAGEEVAAEEDEEGDGKPKAPVLYDSGEDEDTLDGFRMREHVSARADNDLETRAAVDSWAKDLGMKSAALSAEATRSLTAVPGPTVAPTEELRLDWVYGCNSRAARRSVHYTAEGLIVYPSGPMAVMYDKIKHTQRYSMAHCDEMMCMDVHTHTGRAVSGQKGAGDISLAIWRTSDGELLRQISCGEVNGISAVCFSSDAEGTYVVAACQDAGHTIKVFNSKDGRLVASCSAGRKKPLCVSFSTSEFDSTTPSLRILVGGIGHFKTLTLTPSTGSLVPRTGLYGAGTKKHNVLCVAACPLPPTPPDSTDGPPPGNEFLLGCADGSIGVVGRGEPRIGSFAGPVHKGAITAITIVTKKEGTLDGEPPVFQVVTAGVDGFIRVLDAEMQPLFEFNLYAPNTKQKPGYTYGLHPLGRLRGFKSVCVDKLQRKILYSTAAGEVAEIDLESGKDINYVAPKEPAVGKATVVGSDARQSSSARPSSPSHDAAVPNHDGPASPDKKPLPVVVPDIDGKPLVSAHFKDQLHGLCSHPLRQECVTAGDDKTMRIWHLDTHTEATKIDLPDIARCAVYAPNGQLIVAGLGGARKGVTPERRAPTQLNGSICVVSYLQGKLHLVHTSTDASDAITCVAFSPDGSKLLAASLDCNIYVYDALDNFKLLMTLARHTAGVTHLDVSADGKVLVSMAAGTTVTQINAEEPVALSDADVDAVAAAAAEDAGPQTPTAPAVAIGDVANEIVVWDLPSGQFIDRPDEAVSTLCSVGNAWFTRQGPFGLSSIGVFDRCSHAAEVLSISQSMGQDLIASGDCFGAVRLLRSPATTLFAPHVSHVGHTPGGVAKVAFTVGDQNCLSVGRFDRQLLQWSVVRSSDVNCVADEPAATSWSASAGAELVDTSLPTAEEGSEYDASFIVQKVDFHPDCSAPIVTGGLDVSLRAIAGVDTGSCLPPSALFCGQGEMLSVAGRLAFVIESGPGGMLVQRPVSLADLQGTGISSSEEVSAVATSADGRFAIVATKPTAASRESIRRISKGDSDGSGRAVLLSMPSGALQCELASACEGGVNAVAFSRNGRLLALLCDDTAHTIAVYRSASGTWGADTELLLKRSSSVGDVSMITFLDSFAADGGERAADCFDIATVGKESRLKFWRINGRNMSSTSGPDCARGDRGATTALSSYLDADDNVLGGSAMCVTGDENGYVYLWRGGERVRNAEGEMAGPLTAHDSRISALQPFYSASTKSSGLLTASNDCIRIFEAVPVHHADKLSSGEWLQPRQAIDVSSMMTGIGCLHYEPTLSHITCISVDPTCSRLLVSLATGNIVTVAVDSLTVQSVARGSSAKINALVPIILPSSSSSENSPVTDAALTVCADSTIRLYDLTACTVIGSTAGSSPPSLSSAGSGLGQQLVGQLKLTHQPTSALAFSEDTVLVGVSGGGEAGTSGAVLVMQIKPLAGELTNALGMNNGAMANPEAAEGEVDPAYAGADSSSRYELVITGKIQNVGTGGINQMRLSPAGDMLLCCSDDGSVHCFRTPGTKYTSTNEDGEDVELETDEFAYIGALRANPAATPVMAVDFSQDGQYVRTFGKSDNSGIVGGRAVEVAFFDFTADAGSATIAAPKVNDVALIEQLRNLQWATCGSPAAPEAIGVVSTADSEGLLDTVSSIATSTNGALTCCGTQDGKVSVYRHPVSTGNIAAAKLYAHSNGPALVSFAWGSSNRVFSAGTSDNVIMVYSL